jgi:hypothetical protein
MLSSDWLISPSHKCLLLRLVCFRTDIVRVSFLSSSKAFPQHGSKHSKELTIFQTKERAVLACMMDEPDAQDGIVPTSLVTFVETEHGRMRRRQRAPIRKI